MRIVSYKGYELTIFPTYARTGTWTLQVAFSPEEAHGTVSMTWESTETFVSAQAAEAAGVRMGQELIDELTRALC
jgi:hypothetical protein